LQVEQSDALTITEASLLKIHQAVVGVYRRQHKPPEWQLSADSIGPLKILPGVGHALQRLFCVRDESLLDGDWHFPNSLDDGEGVIEQVMFIFRR
jgi:hypothetical protein